MTTHQGFVYGGTGDDVVSINKPNPEGVLATITGNAGGDHFAVQAIDGNEDLLVNTTERYSGTVLLDADGGETTLLQVTAVGPWAITLNSTDAAPRFTDTFRGEGDGVVIHEGNGRRIAKITGNRGQDHFAVQAYSGQGSDLLVNTTDPYTGRVPFPSGAVVVAVTASGTWTIDVTAL